MSKNKEKPVKVLISLSQEQAKKLREEAVRVSLPFATYCRLLMFKIIKIGDDE